MSKETIISLILAFPIGIITGLYSGVILSRFTRFSELRNEVLRIIRTIDFMQEQGKLVITNDRDVAKLTLVVSDLLFLKHKKAADIVARISSDIGEKKMHAETGCLKFDAYNSTYIEWQKSANAITPSKLVIFSLWGKL